MPKKPSKEALATCEVLSAIVAVCAIPVVVLVNIGAHLAFFGEPDVITSDEVDDYWKCITVLGVAMTATFVFAALRGARSTFVWYGVIALLGLAVSLAFSVTQTGPVRPEPPAAPPSHAPGAPPCYSGGDSHECPGG